MYELVYCSEANPELEFEDILNILDVSREFNRKEKITGCLLYFNNKFIQILEGEKESIMSLYKNIEQDQRHHHVLLLHHGPKEKRYFPNWTMSFKHINNSDIQVAKKNDTIDNLLSFSEFADTSTTGQNHFWSLVKQLLKSKNAN